MAAARHLRRLLVAALLTASPLVAAGCGGDEGAPPGPPEPVQVTRGSSLPPAQAARSRGADRLRADIVRALERSVRQMAIRTGPDDPAYYERGTWHGNPCGTCSVAPGMLSAVLARETGRRVHRDRAVATMDRMIAAQTQPDGSFSPKGGAGRGEALRTNQAGTALAVTLLELRDTLPEATVRRWRASLVRASRWLAEEVEFYVNGNINMGEATFLYAAWRATGDPEIERLHERSLAFTLDPGEGRWKGYGLTLTRKPRRADGRDGRGYLAEARGSAAPGFDPYYLTVQEANAAMLHALAGTRKTRRVLNLLTNTLLHRVDRATWTYPIEGGSRRGDAGSASEVPLLAPGTATLALGGDRRALVAPARAQVRRAAREFVASATQGTRQEPVIANFVAPLIAAHRDRLPPPPG